MILSCEASESSSLMKLMKGFHNVHVSQLKLPLLIV